MEDPLDALDPSAIRAILRVDRAIADILPGLGFLLGVLTLTAVSIGFKLEKILRVLEEGEKTSVME